MNIQSIQRQIQHQLATARPTQLVGWLLYAISIIMLLVGVGGAMTQQSDSTVVITPSSHSSTALRTRPVTVEQGMRISTTNATQQRIGISLQFCTLGYIDHERRIGYTSAHCVTGIEEGTYQPGGAPVTTRDQRLIGRIYPNTAYMRGDTYGNDVAVIVFNDNVTLGENKYSGDTVLDPANIDRDTARFCTYGATTKHVQCGTWEPTAARTTDNEFSITGTNTINGDSGSAVWVVDDNGEPLGLYGISWGRRRYADNHSNSVGIIAHSIDADDFEDGVVPAL